MIIEYNLERLKSKWSNIPKNGLNVISKIVMDNIIQPKIFYTTAKSLLAQGDVEILCEEKESVMEKQK